MTALGFTPAKGQDIYWIDEREKSSLLPTAISGAEARSFYEGLVGDADGGSVNPGTGTRTGYVLLDGHDVCQLGRPAGDGEAPAGAGSGVGRGGRHAGQRCQRTGTHSVPERQWCKMCGSHFSGHSSSHHSSTLHQFSLRRQPPTPQYCLPASSASYKMMVRCGWDPRTGLGPDGAGPKQPVSTVLKRDHQGLGYGPIKRARVTHFPAKDPRAVKPPRAVEREGRGDKGKRKEESRRKKETDRNWERDFRTSFNL
ncbi:unnamed protein product [Merluccius merluccius]